MNTPLSTLTTPRRLRRAAAALLAAAVVTVGATACEPTGCQLDCISGVSVNPGATTAKVTTTVGTKVTLHIYSDAAMTKLVGAMSSSTGATTHTVSTGQLGSATTYWWKVYATDANNAHAATRTIDAQDLPPGGGAHHQAHPPHRRLRLPR